MALFRFNSSADSFVPSLSRDINEVIACDLLVADLEVSNANAYYPKFSVLALCTSLISSPLFPDAKIVTI